MYRKYTPTRVEQIRLNSDISVPSTIHGYSLGIQYMQKWFLDKFDEDYFKTIFVQGKSVFDDYRKLSKQEMLTIEKPAVSINPVLDVDYNRDFVDMYPGGLKMFARRTCTYDRAFFKDSESNTYLAMHMRLMKINFNFRIRVKTRAQQLDLYEFMRIAFKTGITHGEYVNMDFHVPKEIIICIAKDNGFEVDQKGNIKNIVGFLNYLNSHSGLPFMYKFRSINGHNEFFIKASHVFMHVNCSDNLSMDDGERQGQLDNNFHVEMNSELKIPVPQFYAYYTNHTVELEKKLKRDLLGMYNLRDIYQMPETNDSKWPMLLSTEWDNDDYYLDTIEFGELLEGNSDLNSVIEFTRKTGVSPSIFLDIHLYNNFKEIPINVDWDNYIIEIKSILDNKESDIAIYVDMQYVNDQLIYINKMYESRIN